MHVLYETLKQFFQAFIVYFVLIFGYSQVSDAAICLSANPIWYATAQNGANNTSATFYAGSGSMSPELCPRFIMSGTEYENLIKGRIDAANINITTLQANGVTLQNNLQTVNSSLQTVADITNANKAKIEELDAYIQTHALRDETNLLHINHDDALTLFYAVMGLFAVAFVWRIARNSLTVADTYTVAE